MIYGVYLFEYELLRNMCGEVNNSDVGKVFEGLSTMS